MNFNSEDLPLDDVGANELGEDAELKALFERYGVIVENFFASDTNADWLIIG